jgi:hypothetical protein
VLKGKRKDGSIRIEKATDKHKTFKLRAKEMKEAENKRTKAGKEIGQIKTTANKKACK